jgi:hypothetical protein
MQLAIQHHGTNGRRSSCDFQQKKRRITVGMSIRTGSMWRFSRRDEGLLLTDNAQMPVDPKIKTPHLSQCSIATACFCPGPDLAESIMARGHLKAPHQKAGQMAAPTSTAEPSINPLPTGSRPQMARISRPDRPFATSGKHPESDPWANYGSFAPKFGSSPEGVRTANCDPNETFTRWTCSAIARFEPDKIHIDGRCFGEHHSAKN